MSEDPDDYLDIDLKGTLPQQGESLWDTTKTIAIAVMIAVVMRTFAYEPFSIPSGSMIPTLLVGDYLFVSKMSYGYSRHSMPFSLPLVPGDRVMFASPERGEVAVFKLPSDGKTDYIKRIIGLPGDTIQVKGGVLHINGQAVERKRIGEFVYQDTQGVYHNTMRYLETLPNGKVHEIIEESDSYPRADNTLAFTVPEGHYFAMGDNRDNSSDSRFNVGFVPRENLVGRADVIFFSNDGAFLAFWNWPWSLRFSRFFNGIN